MCGWQTSRLFWNPVNIVSFKRERSWGIVPVDWQHEALGLWCFLTGSQPSLWSGSGQKRPVDSWTSDSGRAVQLLDICVFCWLGEGFGLFWCSVGGYSLKVWGIGALLQVMKFLYNQSQSQQVGLHQCCSLSLILFITSWASSWCSPVRLLPQRGFCPSSCIQQVTSWTSSRCSPVRL